MIGPYRIGRLLGRGGMAVVYEATQESVGRVVALKLVSPDLADPEFLERFRHEGRMQAALDHPHVVTVYESGTSAHGPYLAMRLVQGTTLAGLIDDGVLTSERTLDLMEQVASALDAAHAAGLVHRDVKPRNVLVEGDQAYLADFGLTRRGDGGGATATGHFMGTIAYAAPEVVSGGTPGPAADRYALAAVLFECLTGTTVFPRPSHAAVLYAHTNEPPPRVGGRREGIPRALDEVLITGLAKDPAARPRRAADLVAGARVALAGIALGPPAPRGFAEPDDGTTAGQVTLPTTVVEPAGSGRGRRGLVAAGLAGLATGAAVVALLGSDDEPRAIAAKASRLGPAPAGSVRLGSDLSRPGRTMDCHGGPPQESDGSCTLFQDRLPGDTTLVVPRNGVVRRWAVRSAKGEFALSIIRDRDGYFQISRSRNEFIADGGPHAFATDLAVDRGDRLALVTIGGSGAGIRPGAGGEIGRFEPQLAGLTNPVKRGPEGELLLRVDYVPGGRPRAPHQLRGAAAADAADGKTLARAKGRFRDGVPVVVRLADVGGRGVIDVIRDGRRTVRLDIEDLHPPIDVDARITLYPDDTVPEQVAMDVAFTRLGSQRLVRHYLVANGRRFVFIG